MKIIGLAIFIIFLIFYIIIMGLVIPFIAIDELNIGYNYSTIKDIFLLTFMWKIYTWKATEDILNLAGRIIAMIFVTILAIPLNLSIFIVLLPCELGYFICWLFIKIFGVKDK